MEDNKISIDISISTSRTIIREASDDEWDQADIAYDSYIKGWYENKTGPYRVDPELPIYAVYVIYTSGDSFHYETGQMEIMIVNQNEKYAKINTQTLINAGKLDDYSCVLFTDEGLELKQSLPFVGYFESLERVDYITVNKI